MERIKRSLAVYQKVKGSPKGPQQAVFPRFVPKSPPKNFQSASAETSKEPSDCPTSADGSLRKVAKLLILLGRDEAVKVIRHLDRSCVESLRKEILSIKKIEDIEAKHILQEFGYNLVRKNSVQGGQTVARSILEEAFGDEKASYVLHKSIPGAKPFAFLEDLDHFALRFLLEGESVIVLSLVLPYLTKSKTAFLLKNMNTEKTTELVKRLSKVDKIPCEVMSKVETALRDKMRTCCPLSSQEVDGRTLLADILRHMSRDKEERLLEEIEQTNLSLGKDIRKRLFTPSQLVHVIDHDFEELLRQKTDRQLAFVWKGVDQALRDKIERNVSVRRMLLIQAELDILNASDHEIKRETTVFLEEVYTIVREGQAEVLPKDEELL